MENQALITFFNLILVYVCHCHAQSQMVIFVAMLTVMTLMWFITLISVFCIYEAYHW